jgi:hypothetical protein
MKHHKFPGRIRWSKLKSTRISGGNQKIRLTAGTTGTMAIHRPTVINPTGGIPIITGPIGITGIFILTIPCMGGDIHGMEPDSSVSIHTGIPLIIDIDMDIILIIHGIITHLLPDNTKESFLQTQFPAAEIPTSLCHIHKG